MPIKTDKNQIKYANLYFLRPHCKVITDISQISIYANNSDGMASKIGLFFIHNSE